MGFPVENKFIETAEQKLGVVLPASYKGRVRRDNGGEIHALDDSWTLYPVFDTSDRRRIRRTSSHIVRETEVARGWYGFPEDGVPLASNGTGDLLIFMPDRATPAVLESTIYYWNHETKEMVAIAGDLADLVFGQDDGSSDL